MHGHMNGKKNIPLSFPVLSYLVSMRTNDKEIIPSITQSHKPSTRVRHGLCT
jgi:hypothetical protein